MTSSPLLLLLGATGSLGRAAAIAAIRAGWRVRALHRDPARAAALFVGVEIDWVEGDALRREDVTRAAQGADWILNALNPPGYRDWRGLALPMLDNSIAAAREVGARIALPGNIYNFGPDAFPLLREGAPQNPISRKGAVRVEIERRLTASGLEGFILRAGDFYGPHCPSSWLSNVMVKPGKPIRSVVYPGDPEVGHSWAYLPDLAETFLRLMGDGRGFDGVETFHFEGHWLERGVAFAEQIRLLAGRPNAPIKRAPWMAIRLLSPFVQLFREILEMRYLWRRPLRLDNTRLLARIGAEPRTDLDLALRRSLEGLGCLTRATRLPQGEPAPRQAA